MSLNLTDAWKNFTPPPSPADTVEEEQAVPVAPAAPRKDASPEAIASALPESLLVSAFPGQAATPLSPTRPRSLFDRPLASPLISSAPAPAYKPDPKRMEELHALILHGKKDPELDALLERNPAFRAQAALEDGSMPSRAALGEQIMRELLGEKRSGEPGLYFLSTGEKLPEAATRQEAYAAVYDHYAKSAEKQYEDNKARRAAYQKNRAEVEQAVSHVVGGVWSPAALNGKLTPEQLSVYRQEFDTEAIEKAHAAFSLLKEAFSDTPEAGLRHMVSERTAMKITSALSEDDGTGKLTINETAFGLFEGSLHKLMDSVKEESGEEWKFMHNIRVALFNPVTKRDASLGTGLQLYGQQQLLVPFAKEHNAQVFGLMEQTVRDYEAYVKNDYENARVLGLLSTGQDMGNQANDRASFASRTVNCLGSIVGQTAPFFIPYAGWGLALAGAYDDKRNRAYYDGLQPGTAEWSAFVDAAASVAVEKISYGGLGRLSWANRVMGKLPFMAKSRKALTDSLWKKVLFESGAGVVEETLVEPTAEAIIQWAVRNNIAPLAGINAGKQYDWSKYWKELKSMLEPDQLLATALFVGGVAGTQSVIAQRSLITHSRSPEMLRMQGIPENEANRISRIEDNKERIAAVREAINKLKTLPPEEVQKNAKEGVKAFRSLAEVRATVESEAYKFFQQEMRLPLVEERADKPGMYDVTIFDFYSGQKKFTQEMTEGQLVSLFGDYFSEEQRKKIAQAQSDFAANAFLRTAEEKKAVQAQDMLRWGMKTRKETEEKTGDDKSAGEAGGVRKEAGKGTEEVKSERRETNGTGRSEGADEEGKKTGKSPSSEEADSIDSTDSGAEDVSVLGRFIRSVGSMSQQGFSYLTRAALNEWNRRLDSGMSQAEAGAAPFPVLSPFAPLGSLLHLDKEFEKRMEIASRTSGEEDVNQTLLFQMRTAPGTTPADYLFLVSRGLVGSREMLEDLFEVGIKGLVKGDHARLQALGELLRETQAGLNKLGFRGEFISPAGPLDMMKVVEAMSKLALSDMLINADSLPLPQWQKDLLQYHVNYLQDAAHLLNLGRAYNLGREKGTITQELADTLRDLGEQVHTIFDQARIEQQDIQAVMEARAIVGSRKTPGGSSEGPTASQIKERQQRDAEEEKAHITTEDRSKERTIPKEALQHPESVSLPEAPESMQGVFVNGASYNPDAGTWIGMVPVEKLHLSPEVPQVKVNAGKKGVVNPLVGEYRADAPPVYVWKRKDGRLEVVSGRHRLDLAQRTGTKAIAAYVYEEDSSHDVSWARLLDYEQNMQDDQADELTAAIYVRETGLTDDELTRRGLTRSGTKSRRGLLIGREAREDLWTRFRSGAIKAQDAEAICLLTQHIQDKGRIDAMQMSAANDLSNGKSLEFIAAKIQLMAHAQADGGMVQGLISFGESFEADMEKAAEYVSRCIVTINEHINAIKGVRNISRKGNVLTTEGITAGLSSDPAERLKELELLKAMYEKIGLYENLRVRALTWDGKTPPDPIGDHRLDMQAERARAAEEAAAYEDEENRKAAAELTDELSFSVSPFSYFPALWRETQKELNDKGDVSFALNGSRVAIYTFSEKEIRKSLEVGRISSSANRREVGPSGSVPAGEIACILHPESSSPDARSASKPDAAGSGKLLPLSDFSGFILPSSLEKSLYPALQGIGVPVRVYHVTEEEAAFFEDPRSMGKDEVEKNDPSRKELQDRCNNVVRSFLEENDISFSLSVEEQRIAATARREDTWMRAPDGTPSSLTERQWLQVHSEAFREWFGESKIVNEHGEPVVVYHGTARADRVGTVFRGDRSTSGPMAFFTDDEKIASNYAKDKRDTSIGYEEEDYYDYHQQFRVTLPSGRDISLERYWHHLSLAEQRRITTLAGHIREDWDGDDSIMVDPSTNDANGGFPYHLQEARGNAFRTLVYHWLESGTLFNEEHRFLEVLAKLNLPLAPRYRDPDHQEPKVYACFMHMENPFRTARITKKIVASLKTASKKAEVARESWRMDLWDKNSVVPEDWIERLENDYENKTTHAWTAIPDWVTECLRKKGYDGIIDQGGKFHADDHTVCIPFDSIQIKSATDNRGTFDPGNPDITFSLSPEERLITEKAKEDGTWLRAPNGQPSRLTEKQWAQTRTKAFLDWYGDWLHGPASASKTLDENGEPLIMYHGGAFDILQFPAAFEDSPGVDGIFFSDSPELAKSYKTGHGGYITTAWLNLKNPFLAQNEASSRLPWVDQYIDYWQKEEGWTDRYTGEAMDKEAARDIIREGFLYDYDMGRRWKDFLGWVRQHHDGYLGHDPTDMEALIAVAFRTEQVKSSLYNNGDFSARQRDITFSLSNLAAVHSLDTEKFLAADKLGGLPLPSLAVTRLDKPYTWGGDDNIYLVGSPALADPAHGVEIHDRDMWSGHFPELRWNRREEKEREEFYRRAEEAALRYYGGTHGSTLRFLKNSLDGDHRGALENKLRHSDPSLAVFAVERGYSPRPLMQKVPGRLHTGDRLFHREVLKMVPWKDAALLSPARQEEFCAAMERAIERYRSQFDQDSRNENLTVMQSFIRKDNLREMEKELKEAREDHFESVSALALIDARQSGKTVLDWQANFKRFERYASEHKKAFDAWVQDKMNRWLNPVPRIRENGFPATLENITRYMLGNKGNGQEQGGIFSTGLLRAKKSRRFHSLDQIKENRDIFVTSNEYDVSQEEAQRLIHKFQEVLYGIVQDFSAFNKAVEALSLIEGEPTPSKVLSALSRMYRGSSYRSRMAGNSYLLGLGSAALHAMKSELRDYYEAVPQRAVLLKEFSLAVLPASMKKNKEVRDVLKRNGIRPRYHDGTLEGRIRVLSSLAGTAVSFSVSPGPSFLRVPDSSFMASLSEEERTISEKALASGAWLKAPNGQSSRLTPRQWVQVRTEAFKRWFGDWLDDPGHASRVVDENGEPRVVYHGTPVLYDSRYGWLDAATFLHRPAPFSVFGEGNWYGAKFFFDDYERAQSFASYKAFNMGISEEAYTFECFLNARKLFNVTDKEAVSQIIDSFPDSVPVVHPQLEIVEDVSREAAEGLVNTSESWILAETKEFQQKLQELGYDGFVAADRGDYYTAVFKPGQIKSATENAGSFDPDSPDITFSVIGPNAATWKQYKKKVFTGRDDGMPRAEIDASQTVLKDRATPYREPLRREMAALRESLPAKTKKQIARYLTRHRQFYRNKRTLDPEKNVSQWHEYLTLEQEKEGWDKFLSDAILRTGLCRQRPLAASVLAGHMHTLELLLREDMEQIFSLADLGIYSTRLTLEEWIHYPELFAAYPQLRNMPVVTDYLSGLYGQYSPAEGTIYLNRNLESEHQVRSVLLHELQHAIQYIEGFAKGGNESSAKKFYEERWKDAQTAYKQSEEFMSWLNARDGMISTLQYMLSLARHPRRVLRTSFRYSYDGIPLRLEGEERILDMARYALKELSGQLERYYDASWNNNPAFDLPWPGNYALNTPYGIRECLKDAKATPSRRLAYRKTPKPNLRLLYQNMLRYERLSRLSSFELYLRMAGEIESRNVQHREDWTEERRGAEPFNDTLEFPGETLVSFSLSGTAFAEPATEKRPSEEFLSSLTEEERRIADRSWENGTWLLAPNGEPSRLTPRQWVQVRTDAFRHWFGEWEHDPLEASRVVDDNGEPLVVYHGGARDITVFDQPTEDGLYFFTENASLAEGYRTYNQADYNQTHLYRTWLNIRNPLVLKEDSPELTDTVSRLGLDTQSYQSFRAEGLGRQWLRDMVLEKRTSMRDYALTQGYDGIFDYEPDMRGAGTYESYIAFRPEQIKSATQNRGTFDPRNPDISFSLAGSLAVQQSITSEDTSMRQVARTFRIVHEKFGGWKKGSVNIDIGGGKYDDFTQALDREGVRNYVYDPFARHSSHNGPVLEDLRRGTLKGDSVTCNNVLNVIPEQEARFNVIHQIAKSLKPEGTAWFCVYEGDGSGTGRVTKTRAGLTACWQENRKTESYLNEIRPFFEEVEIRHGLIIARVPRRTESPASWRVGKDTQEAASFSVIGPSARTWAQYRDRAFVGRDDSKMRAELDSSQAKLDVERLRERDFSELEDITGLFTATSDIKPLIGTRAARFYFEAWETSRAFRAGEIKAEELDDQYRRILRKRGFNREADLTDSGEFHEALKELTKPLVQAIRDLWNFFLNHPLTENAAFLMDGRKEIRDAVLERLAAFLAFGNYRYIHLIFPRSGPYRTWIISEVLDYPELFAAYPILKGIKVDFRDDLPDGADGVFNSRENRITLSLDALEKKSPAKLRSFLLHELQHAVQEIESFASGGNLTLGTDLFFEPVEKERSALRLYLLYLDAGLSEMKEAVSIARNPEKWAEDTYLYQTRAEAGIPMNAEEKRRLGVRLLEKSLSGVWDGLFSYVPAGVPRNLYFPVELITIPSAEEAVRDGGESLQNTMMQVQELLVPLAFAAQEAEKRYQERENRFRDIGGSFGAYQRLAGEIESRNVEHRKDWPEERRAAEPFNNTLEFPGEALVSFSLGNSPANDAIQDSLQNEYETEQSIHASTGAASFYERSLLPRTGEGDPGRGHSDEPAAGKSSGADEGLQAGDDQAGSALTGRGPSRETDVAHSGQFDPAVGVLGVKAYSLSPHLAELAARHDFYTGEIVELDPSAEGATHFRRCLEEAKATQVPYGECVYTYDTEEYEHMRLFLLPNGKAGFALKDGDMVSVFSHKQHGCEGRPSYTVIAQAVQMGASKCDCYGTILPDLYAKFGFRAVARDKFNAEFAPESMQQPGHMESWYGKQEGKPDVVYMVYEGNRERVMEEFDPDAESGFETLPYSDFDACLEIQSRAVERQRKREENERNRENSRREQEITPEMREDSLLSPEEGSSFSLSSLRKIASSLAAPSMQATRAAELVEDFDKAAENWSRVMAGKEEKPSARVGAELFGTINSLISAARFVLPQGYRSRVHLQMQWASVYAAMAESGEIPPKGTLQSGDIFYQRFEESVVNDTMTASTPEEVRRVIAAIGNQRLDRVMSRILDRVRDQLVYFAKDELFEKTMRRVERAYPKKEPGQKSPRGRLEAQAYRNLAQYRFMLAADSKFKENTMTALETKYREEEDVEKQQEQEKELLAWKTFGDYKGMSLVQAQNAMEKLLEFVLSGRNVWDRKLDRERGRTKFTAREIQKNLPAVNSATSRAGAKIEHRSRLKKFLKSVPFGFMSYSHLMLALEPILGQRFTRARMQEIADANAALLNASNDRSAWLYDTICRIAGLKSESAAEQWLVKFNKPEKTKIPMNPVIKIKVSLPIDEAKEWFSLSKEERNARRAEIRENDRRMEIISENVPEEEDISLLREALEEYEKRSPEEQDRQEMLKSVRDIPNPDGSGPLVCSRDCALYAILLHEQPDYADVYDEEGKLVRQGFLHREGLDDEGITALYGFVGTEGLEYGYALRKRLQETGLTLAQVYEERMGVPFTLKENYFRATFDRNSTREKDALTEPKTGSIGGGKYGLLIDRILHSENLDFSKAASLVFLAAAAEQDNYIYTSHITTAWRALLKNKILEQKLKQNLGEDMMGKLSSWMDLIDGASLENNRAFLNLSRMQGMLQRAFAISVLAGNGYVLLKQSTAILHGFFAGWVPSAVLERAEGTREMVHRHISFSDFLFHLAGAKLGLGDISLKDLKESPWFKARMRDKGAMLAQIANLMPGQRYSPLEKLAEKSMDIIEWVDVKANLHSMHALANAYYAKAKELNEMNEFPFTDAQLRQAALQQVGLSLELGAQPLTKTQKSMNQAAGGILSKLTFIMKSEQLNKLGLITAEWKTGSARNRVCAVQSWLALGVTSSMLAWLIAWIKGMDDDDDEKKWRKYGTTALLGDLTTIPLAGEAVNYLASLITGERVFADSYARTLVDVGGITRAAKKEYEHLSEEKEMDWDAHFNNLTALVRAAGVGGAFSRSSSAVVSSYGALSLSAATGANISRTAKDLLSVIFRDEEEERKKKQHKKKPKKTSDQ